MSQIDLEALQQKVRQLETANTRMRIAGGLLLTLIGAGLLTAMTQDRYASTLRAQELVILNEDGDTVARLDGSGLVLHSQSGETAELSLSVDRLVAERGEQKRFDLRIQDDHTQLQVLGAATDTGTQPPGVWLESTGDGGQVGIHDRNYIRAVLGELVLQDSAGQQTTLPSSTLSMYDSGGNLLERIPRR